MSVKETVSKIATGVGKGITNSGIVQAAGHDAGAVINATKKMAKSIGTKGKKINGKYFKDVPEKNALDSLMYTVLPKQIKGKYVYGTAAVVGGIKLINDIGDNRDRASYGKFEGGTLSHMTSEVSSSPLISEMQQGDYDPSHIMHNSSYRDTGATGDIVLALHNRR